MPSRASTACADSIMLSWSSPAMPCCGPKSTVSRLPQNRWSTSRADSRRRVTDAWCMRSPTRRLLSQRGRERASSSSPGTTSCLLATATSLCAIPATCRNRECASRRVARRSIMLQRAMTARPTLGACAPTPIEKTVEPDLGSATIPKERYLSCDFAQLEWERMWTRVWLLAAWERDVERPGDWCTFDVGPESIIVARDRTGRLHAHYNVCLHRGNRLCEAGRGHDPTFSCRYHAWEWNLDGTLRHATDAEGFPGGLPPGLRLGSLRCETWGGFVWVAMDPDAEPLADYLGVIPAHLAPYHFEEHVLVDDVTLDLACNWKTCVDAFNEAYHVQGTHPELLEYSDDVNVQIDFYGRHSRFIYPVGTPSPRLGRLARVPRWLGDIVLRGVGIDPDTFAGSAADVKPAALADRKGVV